MILKGFSHFIGWVVIFLYFLTSKAYILYCFLVVRSAYFEGEDLSSAHNTEYLLELLELILQQFKIVAHVHQIVLANLQRVKVRPQVHIVAIQN